MRRRKQQGLTLVEVMVAMAVLAIMVVAIYMLIFRSSRAYTEGSKMATLYENGRRVLDVMANELRLADTMTTVVTANYNSTGANGLENVKLFTGLLDPNDPLSAQQFNATLWLFLELSPVDANNNGNTADDWRLRRIRQDTDVSTGVVTTQNVVLCDYIKAGGLSFAKNGNNITITLTLQVADDKNTVQERIVTTSVTLRNKSS